VNPLAFDKRGAHGQVIDGGEGSAAEHAARLAPEATVVGAFHNVSAVLLWGEDEYLDEDVLCVGDSDEGKEVAMELARAVTGRPGISAGKLRLARQLEPFTAVLISINRKYKAHSGIRITGLDHAASAERPTDEDYGLSTPDAFGAASDGRTRSVVPTERGDYPAFYTGVAAAIRGDGPVPVDPLDALEVVRPKLPLEVLRRRANANAGLVAIGVNHLRIGG
jgi:hypothetical protein